MRILLFSGKGGVGKTSLAAATGLQLSRLGYRTLVMSVDPAHSLADAFDLETGLFHGKTGDPYPIDDRLAIHEVNIQKEIKRHWREISSYVVSVLRTTGISDVEAEELAILPGMEELSAMMYVNQFRREERYDVIVLDCAPTAESMRFVSMPTTLEWYMKHIFPFQRGLLKAVRPIANRVSPVELPTDSYFANIQDLFGKLDGIDELLEDPQHHQRAPGDQSRSAWCCAKPSAPSSTSRCTGWRWMALSSTACCPQAVTDAYFEEWRASQSQHSGGDRSLFRARAGEARAAVHARSAGPRAPGRTGPRALRRTRKIPRPSRAPKRPTRFAKRDGHYEVRLRLPFAAKGEVGLFKKGDELVVEIGTLRRHIGLPASMAGLSPGRAKLENKVLTVEMKET